MKKIIVDGDWGGDEMQLAAVLLTNPDQVKILGATSVFGNTGLKQVVRNALDVLYFLQAPEIKVHTGAAGPSGKELPEGDNAHGDDGVGGVILRPSPAEASSVSAVSFILDTLQQHEPQSVIITATGPLTNISQAFIHAPEVMRRVKSIYVMGGCTTPMPAADMQERQGNITPSAEFNFFMAAEDAQIVMSSGLPIVLLPMNCTHQLTLTPQRAQLIRDVLAKQPEAAEKAIRMMNAPADFDRKKFNLSPVMHDVNTALCILFPEFYEGRRGTVSVVTNGEARGRSDFVPESSGSVLVKERIIDSDVLFGHVLASLKCRLGTHPATSPSLSILKL